MTTDRDDILTLCEEIRLLGAKTVVLLALHDNGIHRVKVNWNGEFVDAQSRALPKLKAVLTEIKKELE